MNLCQNGHDKDVVGTTKRQCRACRNERRRKGTPRVRSSLCSRGHDMDVFGRAPRGGCLTCKRDADKRKNERISRERAARRGERALAEKLRKQDGFEDEYGPVPERVPNSEWLDWVIVHRLLAGIPTGRNPTRLEWAEFFARNKTTTYEEVQQATGLSNATIWNHSRESGYTWPYELTRHAGSRKE